jgi:hypothetical protein
MSRYDPDGTATVVASWSGTGAAFPVGTYIPLGGRNAHTLVFKTHRPARISDYAGASGPTGEAAREFGFRASVSVPGSRTRPARAESRRPPARLGSSSAYAERGSSGRLPS